jgi:hypothetical protein
MRINMITCNKQAANNATISQCRSLSSIWRQILGKYKIIIKILYFSGKIKTTNLELHKPFWSVATFKVTMMVWWYHTFWVGNFKIPMKFSRKQELLGNTSLHTAHRASGALTSPVTEHHKSKWYTNNFCFLNLTAPAVVSPCKISLSLDLCNKCSSLGWCWR